MIVLALAPVALARTGVSAPGDGWRFAIVGGVVGLLGVATWIAIWALSGRLWPAYVALAVTPAWALAELAGTPAKGLLHNSTFSIAAFAVSLAAFGWFLWAVRSPQVDSRWKPIRPLAAEIGGVIGLFVAVGITRRLPVTPAVVAAALGVATVTTWWVAAGICLRCCDLVAADKRLLAVSLAAFGFATADRTVGRLSSSDAGTSWALLCGCAVALVGWLVLLGGGLHALARARDITRWRQGALRESRNEITQRWHTERRTVSENRHDLRSLAAGIQQATSTLMRYRGYLDVQEQQHLESAIASEIRRLACALNADLGSAQRVRFSLRSAIEPVIVAERARGTIVYAELVDIDVVGSANGTAALMQNLLFNAYRHAPGAVVHIVAVVDGPTAKLRVFDDGPGLPEAVRRRTAALFAGSTGQQKLVTTLPRQRAGTDPDDRSVTYQSGLGLAICARLAREQGAGIRFLDAEHGTAVEISLPLADAVDAGWLG